MSNTLTKDSVTRPYSPYGTAFKTTDEVVTLELGDPSGTTIDPGQSAVLSSPVVDPFLPQNFKLGCEPPELFELVVNDGVKTGALDLATYSPRDVSMKVTNTSKTEKVTVHVVVFGPAVVKLP